jgi:hypothetical protein
MDAATFEPSAERRQRLHELFADLADTPDKEALVARLIDTLVRVACPNPKITPAPPQTFRRIGRRRSDAETRSALKQLQKVRDAVANLSGTSIDRLADQGGLRQPFVGDADRLIAAATEALKEQGAPVCWHAGVR